MSNKLDAAVERLASAFSDYDACKRDHAETTQNLTEAKKQVELAARAVVDASSNAGQPDLFDHAERTRTVTQTEVDGQPARVVADGPAALSPEDVAQEEADIAAEGAEPSQEEISALGAELAAEREAEGVTLSGTTGAPLDFEMVEDPEAPGLCVCGWEIASPIPGHDRRHEQYLLAVEDEKNGSPASRHKPRGRRKAGDMTSAVGKRARGRAKGA